MRRLRSGGSGALASWFYRNFGLVALYKYASEYGESYMRPFVAIVVVLVAFTLLFPLAGLDKSDTTQHFIAAPDPVGLPLAEALSYRNFKEFARSHGGNRWTGGAAFFGNSFMTALSVAGFQKELRYEPSYPWGRVFALAELLFTSTLIALFLLAVRRQFKR